MLSQTRRKHIGTIGVLFVMIGLVGAMARGEGARKDSQPAPARHEERAVPPPPPGSIASELPRSPARDVSFGGLTSVQVNLDANGNNIVGDAANEPSIAIDPTDPDRIVIGWRQFDTIASDFRQAGVSYSHDGGVTWTNVGPLDPGQFRSDPVLGADNNGTFFYLSLSDVNAMQLMRSFDGGVTWGMPIPAFGGDKEWMVVDTTGGTGDGNIYTDWNTQFSCCGTTDFARSTNGGTSFPTSIDLPEPRLKWGMLDVGPQGQLYVAGTALDLSSHIFVRSTHPYLPSQPTFDLVHTFDLGGATGFSSPVNPQGLPGQVNIAVDRSNLPTSGIIYVLGSVTPPDSDPLDVYFVRSVDGGNTFSAPMRVNSDSTSNGAWQWFGTMSVAPNGRIDVVWLDTRNASSQVSPTTSELYYTYSLDTGLTWATEVALTPPFDHTVGYPGNPPQQKMGDYYHMISDNGGANLAYSATFNGEEDVYFLRIPADCNGNGTPDDQDVLVGGMTDCNGNLVPDVCESTADCNNNSTPDICELAAGASVDCNRNLILDECEDTADCNNNSVQDLCEVFDGSAPDCNANGVPDECDIASGTSQDDNGSGVPDECEDACCLCTGCIETSQADCLAQGGRYAGPGTSCATTDCTIPNDSCESAEILPGDTSISFDYDNRCASDDGPATANCDTGLQLVGADLWYEYVTPCCGELTVSLCDNTDYDAFISIYGGGETCTCPTGSDGSLQCGDDSCGIGGGPGFVTLSVDVNQCYEIRVGGWQSQTGTGTFDLTMTCVPDSDGDGLCGAADNCPNDYNPGQEDADGDGLGDACDSCPNDPNNDEDGDGICGDVDNCPTVANADQTDTDGNGVGDACEPTVIYVDASNAGPWIGLDWFTAFNDLQDALEQAAIAVSLVPVEVWVADGTYVPSVATTADPRSVTFDVPDGVRLLGGFAGDEATAAERDPSVNVTILSGDINGDDGPFPGNNAENAYNVVTFATPGDPSEIDGFTITRGNANGSGTPLTTFIGGGVVMNNDFVTGTVAHCIVTENVAGGGGGGIGINTGPNAPETPAVRDSLIANNISTFGGGLITTGGSAVSITSSRFVGNVAVSGVNGPGLGGGMVLIAPAETPVAGCEFRGNSADNDGGAIYVDLALPGTVIANSTISDNTAQRGGGIYHGSFFTLTTGTTLDVTSSILYGNSDNSGSGEAAQLTAEAGDSFSVNNNCIEGLTGGLGGSGNIGDDPKFVVPDVDLHIKPTSPAVDAGLSLGYLSVDLDGNPRIFDGNGDGVATIDMGAYESQVTVTCLPADAPLADGGPNKSRYFSIVPGNAGASVALRVMLVNVDGFPAANGTMLWVGPPQQYTEEDSSDTNRKLWGAALSCEPYFTDWGSIDVLHVYGGEVVPASSFEVAAVDESCADYLDDPTRFSEALPVSTGTWGDMASPFDGEVPAVQPDFTDISADVDKFLATPAAPIKASAQLHPNTALPSRPVDFTDIAATVSAFLGDSYVASIGATGPCACPSAVTCGATACGADTACGSGYCVGGFCVDACGRCTP